MTNNMTALQKIMPAWLERIEDRLAHWLPNPRRYRRDFHQAMRYSTLDGGKRIRPLLMYATGVATQQNLDQLDGPACAVEMIHVYSLIHDDLPCMDDDDLRRGKPTCHKAYGLATAVLAGDALQALAFKILATDPAMTTDAKTRIQMIATMATAAGYQGMAGGQAIDLDAVGKKLTLFELEEMHIYKTGELIRAAVNMAAMNQPNLDDARAKVLNRYAECIGLAFQIRDDILDIEGDTETLGKQHGADQALGKPTFPDIIGLKESKIRLTELHEEALGSLDEFGEEADVLRDIANYIVDRVK
ncbi:MAG TPA: geranyl transferase [Gammaproteobacteria bacterium]|nr:geranyl transferase [Gammaproteobacteria bacterium]